MLFVAGNYLPIADNKVFIQKSFLTKNTAETGNRIYVANLK